MATGTAGTNARRYHQTLTHYLRKTIAFSDGNGAVVTVGALPAGAVVDRASTLVITAFNAGTANTMNIGTVATPTAYASATALGTVAQVVGTLTAAQAYRTTDTVVVATLTASGTAPTAGQAIVTVFFTVDNDG
jgi:hypothetical protein